MDILLRTGLVVTACFLAGVISVLFVRYRKISLKRDVRMSKEEVLGKLFLRKIRALGEEEGEPPAVLKKLSGLMRTFFSELFDISYEFDYVELNEELGKRGTTETVRKDIIDYSMRVEEFLYGGKSVGEAELSSLIEKSVIIIQGVTEDGAARIAPKEKEEKSVQSLQEKQAPAEKKQGKLSAQIESFIRKPSKPLEKPQEKAEGQGKPKEPEDEVPQPPGKNEAGKKSEKPAVPEEKVKKQPPMQKEKATSAEKAAEEKIRIPPESPQRLAKIRKLLATAEASVSSGNAESAMESYVQLRDIYESLTQDERRAHYEEARRIIALYNSLLGEYKDALSAGKS